MVRCHIAGDYLFCVHLLWIYSIRISQKFRFPKTAWSYWVLFFNQPFHIRGCLLLTCESANMNMCNVSPEIAKSEGVITNVELRHFKRSEVRFVCIWTLRGGKTTSSQKIPKSSWEEKSLQLAQLHLERKHDCSCN